MYLNIGEVGPDDTVHDTPDVRDRILVVDLDTELFPNKTAGTFATEQVLGANSLDNVRV
jgi:hypothetical protein